MRDSMCISASENALGGKNSAVNRFQVRFDNDQEVVEFWHKAYSTRHLGPLEGARRASQAP